MRVINKTVWKTAQLKAILQKAAEQEFDDGSRRKKLVVTVKYTRRGESSGCAWIGGNRATVRIYNPKGRPMEFSHDPVTGDGAWTKSKRDMVSATDDIKMAFAKVACHEFAHCRGMSHAQMPRHYRWNGNWKPRVAWALALPLDVQAERAQPAKTDVVAKRHAHVVKMRERAETRLKRAQTILKKWKQSERYYERKAAAQKPCGYQGSIGLPCSNEAGHIGAHKG